MSKPFYLTQNIDPETIAKGEIKGIAYSGSIIPSHGFLTNLIIDLDTMTIERNKLPILRDHNPSQVSGFGNAVVVDGKIQLEGKISKKTSYGREIIELSEDGFEWQLSIGLFNGTIEEVKDAVVNGVEVPYGSVLRNTLLREVSVVAIGADRETSTEILSNKPGDKIMLSKLEWEKFACGCGGDKTTTPDELSEKINGAKLQSEADKAEIAEKEIEIEELKKAIAEKQAEIDAIKAGDEEAAREEKIDEALKAKNIEFAAEKIKEAAKTKEGTEMLLSLVESMKAPSKIDSKFAGKQNLGNTKPDGKKQSEQDIRFAAEALVKEGKANNFLDAIAMVEEK